MLTLCDVDGKAGICWYHDQQSLTATVPNYYDIRRAGFGDARDGGQEYMGNKTGDLRRGAFTNRVR